MRPVQPCRITNPFGAPGDYASSKDNHGAAGHHTGIDFGSAWPIPINKRVVRAVLGGEVVISGYNGTMGNWVGVYNHEKNLLVTYWHLSSRAVAVGSWVLPFRVLGRVGSTGNSTAPHLHLQVNKGRDFDYSGHDNPAQALMAISRKDAKAQYKRLDGKHPMSHAS